MLDQATISLNAHRWQVWIRPTCPAYLVLSTGLCTIFVWRELLHGQTFLWVRTDGYVLKNSNLFCWFLRLNRYTYFSFLLFLVTPVLFLFFATLIPSQDNKIKSLNWVQVHTITGRIGRVRASKPCLTPVSGSREIFSETPIFLLRALYWSLCFYHPPWSRSALTQGQLS